MAGAVMVNTLGMEPPQRGAHRPSDYVDEALARKLLIINDLRAGWIHDFNYYSARQVLVPNKAVVTACTLIRDNLSASLERAPWRVYIKAARILQKAGL
jgi:hypothetical protein